jgi:class 3 adenylate cyclase
MGLGIAELRLPRLPLVAHGEHNTDMAEPGGIVALLFTDLVGSTSMYDRIGDEGAETVRRAHFAALRHALAAHGGEEVKSLGDGLMVAFTSAVAAVEAAIAMQRAAQGTPGTQIRVGLHAGEPLRDEGDYFGVSVNTARRLCDVAGAGQILASDLIRALVSPRIRTGLRPVGELALKGIVEPVWAYEVEWAPPADAPAVPPLLAVGADAPFVGRAADLDRLTRRWKDVVGGASAVVLVSGEPGIGKTRLVAELTRQALSGPVAVLAGRSDAELATPLGPYAEAVRSAALLWPADLLPLVPAAGPEPLPRHAGAGEDLRETERMAIFGAVTELLEATSAAAPLLFVLDDLHWADESSLLLLRHLLRLRLPRVLFVVTYRDTELARTHPLAALVADLRREDNVERVVLRGLGGDDVRELLGASSGHADGALDELATRITADTEGNPFFVHEVVRHLVETGRLAPTADGGWEVVGIGDVIDVPEGIREVIGRRVSKLSEACNELLAVASVIGRRFSARLLADAAGRDLDATLDAIDEALGARLLEEDSSSLASFAFSHALVRETLYREVSTVARLRLHHRIAVALRSTGGSLAEIAHHLLEAGPAAPELETAEAALEAAEDARFRLAAFEDARSLASRALAVIEDRHDALRCDLLTVLGDSQIGAAEYVGLDTLRAAVELGQRLQDGPRIARAAIYALRAGVPTPQLPPFLTASRAALDLLREPTPMRARLRAALALAGETTDRDADVSAALAEARASGDDEAFLYAALARADVELALGDAAAAAAILDEGATRIGPGLTEAILPFGTRYFEVALVAGDRVEAEVAMARIEAHRDRFNSERWTDRLPRAGFALLDGDLDEAARLAATEFDSRLGAIQAAGLLGVIALEQDAAAAMLPVLEAEAAKSDLAAWRAAVALFLIEAGRPGEARRWTVGVVEQLGLEVGSAIGLAIVAEVAFALDDVTLGRDTAAELDRRSGRTLTSGVLCFGAADRYQGLCAAAAGDLDGAARRFEAALDVNAGIPAPLYLAHTQVDLAMVLGRRGRDGDAARSRSLAADALASAERLRLPRAARRAGAALGGRAAPGYD